jgi:hypothetical protein
VHGINDVRHTVEPLVPEPSSFEIEIDIKKLKTYKLPGIDQILTELIKQEVIHYILRATSLLILFGIRKNWHSSGRSLLL